MNNQTVDELNNRKLNECYFSIMCIPVKIYLKRGENNTNLKQLYVFYGCTLQGVRKFITATIADDLPKTSDWYNFLLNLKKRNLNVILYANIPNNKQLKDAFSLAFPESEIFISCFEPINKILKYFSWNYSSKIFTSIKDIYLSDDINGYNISLSNFYGQFGDDKFIIDLLSDDLNSIRKYYEYNVVLRKHIFSFYFNRDTIKKLNVLSHSKPFFISSNDFVQSMIPLIKTIETRMYSSKSDWINLINFIYPIKKELIISYL